MRGTIGNSFVFCKKRLSFLRCSIVDDWINYTLHIHMRSITSCAPPVTWSSMWSILIVPENADSPHLLGTAKFAIHALCTQFVGMFTWLSSFHADIFPPKVPSVHNDKTFCSRWLDDNIWSEKLQWTAWSIN